MLWGRRQLELELFDLRVLAVLQAEPGCYLKVGEIAKRMTGRFGPPHTNHVRRSLRKLRIYDYVERDLHGGCRATRAGMQCESALRVLRHREEMCRQ